MSATADLYLPAFQPAHFSACRTWRYRLERRWSEGELCGFILLNPSTADETKNDPTIRRCIAFAKAWGFGGLVLGNIFALRSTDPKGLYSHSDPIGVENDAFLGRIASETRTLVCGWGVHGAFQERGDYVKWLLRRNGVTPMALKVTAEGHPGHPLYIKASTPLAPLE